MVDRPARVLILMMAHPVPTGSLASALWEQSIVSVPLRGKKTAQALRNRHNGNTLADNTPWRVWGGILWNYIQRNNLRYRKKLPPSRHERDRCFRESVTETTPNRPKGQGWV